VGLAGGAGEGVMDTALAGIETTSRTLLSTETTVPVWRHSNE